MKVIINKNALQYPKGVGNKILWVVIWYLIAWAAVGYLGAPKVIVYLGDLLNLYVFLSALYYKARKGIKLNDIPLLFMILFSIIGILSALVNYESLLLLIWGMRNNIRFFLFYYSCLVYLREEHLVFFIKMIKLLFWISLPLCIYERFFITYSPGTIVGDYVGGVYFGFQGVTPPFNILMVIYCTYVTVNYFEGKCKTKELVTTIGVAMIMAAMAELKIFIVEIVIILGLISILKKKSLKTVILIIASICAMTFLVTIFIELNGEGRSYYTEDIFSIKGMWEIVTRETGYDGVGDLNRFSGIDILKSRFMNNDPFNILFGIGLGNGDYAQYDFLTSSFYRNYSYLHYQWFSSLFVFLETGYIGLSSYILIFVSALIQGYNKLKKQKHFDIFYVIIVIVMIIMIFYGNSLRSEQSGFILYMILGIPTALERQMKESSLVR